MADEVIDTPAKLFFHLLIIGHEIAHVVHRHINGCGQSRDDYRALEMWADFYGAKVMMCLLTFGHRVRPKFKTFYPDTHFLETALEGMGEAAGRLVAGVYTTDRRYPYPLLRVGLVCNGVTSFLRREINDAPSILPFSVYKRIFSSPQVKELLLINPEHLDADFEPLERARRWHLQEQGEDAAIAPWLLPRFLDHLHTSFQQTPEELEASRITRLNELLDAGLLSEADVIGDSFLHPTGSEDTTSGNGDHR
ncbi:hypothetical protein [Sphingomicrobium aestuariivivum]|uniref:hypothetical protein n=1 Tax=Sphingomicrobium aestuariivivum TaxID=1582356 RepID=UPI001FD6C4CB|nr:hypothetical protein [Sphingomicrobium aestuariivivum]MCJ8190492.1 hypothetical protein [Sphingomicrobium aestuariivivum]